MVLGGAFIGLKGILYVSQKPLEAWVLGSSKNLTTPCWPSKFGAYFKIKTLYFSISLNQKFSLVDQFFDAKENKGSFAWRSILKGRDLIRSGLKWRIVNGSRVRIFLEAWLPGSRQGRVLSPVSYNHKNSLVSSLINQVDKS